MKDELREHAARVTWRRRASVACRRTRASRPCGVREKTLHGRSFSGLIGKAASLRSSA